jgi:hypothetical protein
VPLDYQLETSLFRVKTRVDGDPWTNDPDVADPSVELPTTMLSASPGTRLAWQMPNRTGPKVKIKVTFRDAAGAEVAGTFTAYAFVVVPTCAAEKALGEAVRPSIEKNPPSVNGTSAEPMVLDELGVNDVFGLRFSNISAGDAIHMFVRMEEVD